MAFERIAGPRLAPKLPSPTGLGFDPQLETYLQALVKEMENQLERTFRKASQPLTTDKNPQREAINLDGKSGNIRVDLKNAQLSYGSSVLIYATALGGNTTITGIDNAYNWTHVLLLNLDPTNSLVLQENSEHLLDTGADATLGQYDMISIMQVDGTPKWVQTTQLSTNS